MSGLVSLIGPKAGGWGEIRAGKGAIRVDGIEDGAEQELRFLLESVVTQINSDLGQSRDGDTAGERQGNEDPREQADRAMSERFRSFAHENQQS